MSKAAQRVRRNTKFKRSKQFTAYLNDPFFAFPNGDGKYTRSEIASLTETPCVLATRRLSQALTTYKIDSPLRLYAVGLGGLLRCRGIGERAAWIAAIILEDYGYDVLKWCDRDRLNTRTVQGSIAVMQSRTRTQKQG
jgi:hypothetical protein